MAIKLNYAQFHKKYGLQYNAYQKYLETGTLPKLPTTEETSATSGSTPTGRFGYSDPEWATLAEGWDPNKPVYAEGYDPSQGMGEVQQLINPETGLPYTFEEIAAMPGGVGATGGGYGQPITTPTTTEPCDEDGIPCSISGKPPVTPMEVTPAPAYEISPEQQEMQDLLGTTLTDWVEAGGYGLSPEVQAQMIQQQTDTLKAREQENIRVMKNNMERRGITNSGYIDANMHVITSNTTVALAGAIADVQIKSALMKMASFEKAMGAAAQFLGYLSEQSQLAYAPEFATWSAEQMAKMQAWQAEIDIMKMAINQAYQQQNIKLQSQLTSQLNAEQHQFNLQLAQMEIDATQEMAKAEGQGSISGTIVTGLFSLGAALLL